MSSKMKVNIKSFNTFSLSEDESSKEILREESQKEKYNQNDLNDEIQKIKIESKVGV